jgi:DnaJ-class molecular chaperone
MTDANYYQVLGVPPSASERSIRDAYLALVRQLHPDRVGPSGTSRFQDITAAYEILSDPARRRQYDSRCGRCGIPTAPGRGATRRQTARRQPEPLVAEPSPLESEPEPIPPSLEGLLRRVMHGTSGSEPRTVGAAELIELRVVLTRAEADAGVTVPIAVPVLAECHRCGGLGGTRLPCLTCGGQGQTVRDMVIRLPIPPRVPDRTVIDLPPQVHGMAGLHLRLHIAVREGSLIT